MASLASLPRNLVIRVVRKGCTNRPFYHVVVQPTFSDQFDDSNTIEQVGTYDPMANTANDKLVALNFDRIKFYLGSGARTSKTVSKLLGLCGFLPVHPMSSIIASRNRKKFADKEELEDAVIGDESEKGDNVEKE